MNTIQRYNKDKKCKVEVNCPNIIMCYNSNIDGIDKNDMHLYQTPMKSKWWYLLLFAYVIDLYVVNSWLIYKHDCYALKYKKIGSQKV